MRATSRHRLRGDLLLAARSHTREATAFLSRIFRDAYRSVAQQPGDLWRVLDDASPNEDIRSIFIRARHDGTSFVLPEEHVFPTNMFPFVFQISDGSGQLDFEVDDPEALAALAQAVTGEGGCETAHKLIDEFRGNGLLDEYRCPTYFERPGIYRAHHACLVIRSESATVVVDPVTGMDQRPGIDDSIPLPFSHTDAVLISHSHEDHFSLFTLMQFPRDTTMIVPLVRRGSMLTRHMAAELRAVGFTHVIEAEWGSSHQIKDITIDALPFYGEQPWLTFESPIAELRNCGNTYLVDACGVKAWVLIDSGIEYSHSMEEVVSGVLAKHGHIDVVLSNLREFPWAPHQIDGSGRYWLCFPIKLLQQPELWPTGRCMTFGIEGMASFLGRLRPSHFLPYAHWWEYPGRMVEVDPGRPEHREVRRLGDLAPLTQCHTWAVGDRWEISRTRA